MSNDIIKIRGARQHNLKNINVDIPRNTLTVLTGLSGSGKSSLAFDTIYAEGQRRYVESLSAYARQFLEQMGKPDVDSIEGLSPAISIEQKTTAKNPRSTVGTVTEIYDYLRLLFARVGKPHCPHCKKPIHAQTVQQIVDQICAQAEGTKLTLLAPIVRARKGEYKKELEKLQADGFTRVVIDNQAYDLGEDIVLDKNKKHDIDVIVDRLVLKSNLKNRVTDSVETALKRGHGYLKLEKQGEAAILISEKLACMDCGFSLGELEPRMFSFNNPAGACTTCSGLGEYTFFDEQKVVPDPDLSIEEGAVKPWASETSHFYPAMLACVCKHYKQNIKTPWKKLSDTFKQIVLNGSQGEEIAFMLEGQGTQFRYRKPFEGVLKNLERRFQESESENVRDDLEKYMSRHPCQSCRGERLKPESLSVLIDALNISKVSALSVSEALSFIKNVQLSGRDRIIADKIFKEIHDRLYFLEAVGLDYLSLERKSGTLSGGESQRIRLATQIGSALVGVLYVLDEPSIGLHQRDNEKLLQMLKRLRDLGNTVLVVEHDVDTMLEADYIVDLGPLAGRQGGHLVACGTPKQIMNEKKSLTGQYLSLKKKIEIPKKRREGIKKSIVIKGAHGHNLKHVDVSFPLGQLVCVSGVSGSGKSTLVLDTLFQAVAQKFKLEHEKPEPYQSIDGLDAISGVVDIDQSPIGRTPRSNPATYTGLFTPIRELFASLPMAKQRGYNVGRFSFNVKGGRCESCEGDGVIKIDMQFLPDMYVTCEVCNGQRYNRDTLEVKYKEKSIAEILAMTVDEALVVFENIPTLKRKLNLLSEVGLGYIQLGQAATTLSGGEAQRIKLSKELSKKSGTHTLYILDEPTTGLHFADVEKLLSVLARLVDQGNSVIVIEHNLDVIKTADHVIDLGPEGGKNGGTVIATGTPEEISKIKKSYTGQFLAKILPRS